MEWVRLVKAVVVFGSIAFVAWLGYQVWQSSNVTGTFTAPFEWGGKVIRTVRGTHQHDTAAEKPLSSEEEMAAVRIAHDAKGEIPQYLVEVMNENFDAMLRQKELGVSFGQCFRKACLWTTLDWNHEKNVPFYNLWGWVDTDLERTRNAVPPDILKEARKIVVAKRGHKPDPRKCAIYIVRPDVHSTTFWSGEKSVRAAIKALPRDPLLEKMPYRTEYHCRPEDLAKLKQK
jgi:hypothetical protein